MIETLRNLPRPREFKSLDDAQKYNEDLLGALERWQVETTDKDKTLEGVVVRPEWYGAKGDGTHDDTTAIQAAIAAAPLGGTILLSAKTYHVNDIALNRDVKIIGQGGDSILSVDAGHTGIVVSVSEGWKLEDFQIYFATSNASNIGVDIDRSGEYVSKWVIKNLYIACASGVLGIGIRTNFALCGEIINPLIRCFDKGISLRAISNAISIRGGNIESNDDGIVVESGGAENLSVVGTTIEGNVRGIVNSASDMRVISVKGCWFENTSGIGIESSCGTISSHGNIYMTHATHQDILLTGTAECASVGDYFWAGVTNSGTGHFTTIGSNLIPLYATDRITTGTLTGIEKDRIEILGKKITYYDYAHEYGFYEKGSIIFSNDPVGTDKIGWQCTSSADTTIATQAEAGEKTISVASTSGMLADDHILVTQDNGSFLSGHIDSINSGTSLTMNNGISVSRHADVGAAVYTHRWKSFDDIILEEGFSIDSPIECSLLTVNGGAIIENGGFESWGSSTYLNSWTAVLAGSSTVNRESTEKHGGSYSCRFDIDSSNSKVYIYQTTPLVYGTKHNVSFWYKTESGKTCRGCAYYQDGGITYYLQTDGTWKDETDPGWIGYSFSGNVTNIAWTQFQLSFNAPNTSSSVVWLLDNMAAASSSLYFDDFVLSCAVLVADGGVNITSGNTYQIADVDAVNQDVTTTAGPTFDHLHLTTGPITVAGTQVVGARVVDARADDVANSGDATTDGLIDALRDCLLSHGLLAAS